MTRETRRTLIAYAVACAAVTVAAALRMMINPLLIQSLPLITFYPAVMISGWFGGLGPGLLATGLSTAVAAFLSDHSSHPFLNGFGLTLFAIVGVAISALNETLHRAAALEHPSREDAERALAAETVARQDAQRATHVKDMVLAMVSHEIRAPDPIDHTCRIGIPTSVAGSLGTSSSATVCPRRRLTRTRIFSR
jgi:hypothetical protein